MSSTVYKTEVISGPALLRAFEALNVRPTGRVALKMHWGEPGNQNYLRPELLRPLYDALRALPGVTAVALVDSNVYYTSPRQTTEGNRRAALDHGYDFAPIDVLDSAGEIHLAVPDGMQVNEAILGAHIQNYDWIVSVAHFKGHGMAGFGGTFKNLAIGIASVAGKAAIHRDSPTAGAWSSTKRLFMEKIIDYNKALMTAFSGKMLYINVLNNLSDLCDCDADAPAPELPDLGILSSLDPVALDSASLDWVTAADAHDHDGHGHALMERIAAVDGGYQVTCAAQAGLGSAEYQLIPIE
jgi:uncharacterized Fe-S center protein